MSTVSINLSNYINNMLPDRIDRGLERAGQLVENEAKQQVTEGDNKALDSGTLRASITHQVDTDDKSVSIGSNVEYAPYVHDGTYKKKARPFLQDAINENMAEIIRCLRE